MLAWKVMHWDPASAELVSGANSRLRFKFELGGILKAPGGIWLSLDKNYVLQHYAVHDSNALLALRFMPSEIIQGNLTDRETEFAVSRCVFLSMKILTME